MYWVAAVTLNPRVVYGDKHPTAEEEEGLHHKAHEQCFISQSVIVGFTLGAAILLVLDQLKNLLGLPAQGGRPGPPAAASRTRSMFSRQRS